MTVLLFSLAPSPRHVIRGLVGSGFMKNILGVIILGLLWCNVSYAENINLTCISNDKSMSQTIINFADKDSELNQQVGFVNGNFVKVDVTDASYILKHEIGPEELAKEKKIQVTHVIDRTTGTKHETWISPNKKPLFFQGKCQLVKPKF